MTHPKPMIDSDKRCSRTRERGGDFGTVIARGVVVDFVVSVRLLIINEKKLGFM